MSIAKINTILTQKFGTTVALTNVDLVPHPADIILMDRYVKAGNDVSTYVKLYEPFEIRSKNKVYSHILINTIDTTNPKVMIFDTDVDINTTTQVLGSVKGKKHTYNGVEGYYRRRVVLDYASIDSVEYITFKPEV